MSDDTQIKTEEIVEKVEEAKTGDILSEVKEPNPYHVVYEENEGLEKIAKWYEDPPRLHVDQNDCRRPLLARCSHHSRCHRLYR